MSASLLVVGVCSFLFHATLRHGPQYSDDVSMLFLAGALLQRLCTAGRQQQQHRQARVIVTTAIYAAVGAMSAAYMSSGNLLVHTSMFMAMLALIGLRTTHLILGRREGKGGGASSAAEEEEEQRRGYFRRFGGVCAYLALAFLLWNIDLQWCHELRGLQRAVGLPWAWLLELHGWWHVLTALGAALHMELVRELCP